MKTVRFRNPSYVGDPINAIKIFNEKEVDELVLLDITASRDQRGPSLKTISEIASECFMPLAYGGGVRDIETIKQVLAVGVEKIVLNTVALENFNVVEATARELGSQSVVVSIDVKHKSLGGYRVYATSQARSTGSDPVSFARSMESAGAGEILLTSVDRDGTGQGFDLELVRLVSDAVSIPVVACGGAGRLEHFSDAVSAGASAVAAGSMFVYVGKHRAVMINYPQYHDLDKLFSCG